MRFQLFAFLLFVVFNAFGQDPFRITHGPYIQYLDQNSATIVWTTNKDAVSWVELVPGDSTNFYLEERPKFFSAEFGFKDVSKIHSIRVGNLKPGTKYRYRVYSQEVLKHEGTSALYGGVAATSSNMDKSFVFSTIDPTKENKSFVMINDIHGNNKLLENLLVKADFNTADFILFNGDMASSFRSEDQVFGDFMDTAVRLFAKDKPMYYCRGNHETRGNFANEFPKYFPSPSGKLYYLLREGAVCFVVLDGGEDKPDSDIEYSGLASFDAYRDTEMNWLKEAIKSKDFTEAAFKIVLVHMPPFGGWHGDDEIARKFVPILNEAGIDVMLCGHMHQYIKQNQMQGVNFPIIVNSNNTVLKGVYNNDGLNMKIINEKGEQVDSIKIMKRH